mgnify:CR=1 FL=1|tara:strand:+ start:522 stop:1085 length:564 start_codon:yes stop_codon:yes gene_type:complete
MSGANDLLSLLEKKMVTTLEVVRKEFGGLRTGRATTSLLEPIMVEAYGNQVPLNQVGSVAASDPRLLTVQVWDKGQVQVVEKAIRESNLGLNPAVDGQLIRVPIPALNEERRVELKKIAGNYAEEGKIAIRNVRRDGNDQLKKLSKNAEISEDEVRELQDSIQKLTDSFVEKIDKSLVQKQDEIMQV